MLEGTTGMDDWMLDPGAMISTMDAMFEKDEIASAFVLAWTDRLMNSTVSMGKTAH